VYHPTTRVLTVLELLQARGRLSGPEIAERLEVDLRTVRRYVTMLQDLGIPVEAERGRHGGYRLRPGYRLPPLVFNEEEALALMLGLLAARRLGMVTAAATVEGALAKLERALPPDVRERVGAVQETLTLDPPPGVAVPATTTVLSIGAAVQGNRRVRIRYLSSGTVETERLVDPYGLVHVIGRWYVPGFCHLRQDTRLFRLDRILTIAVLDEVFAPPPDFDPLAFVQASLADAPGSWRIEAFLAASLEEAEQRVSPYGASLEAHGDGVIARFNVDSLDWAARYLVALGVPFVVLQPVELREALRELAVRIDEASGRSGVDEAP
jgi:predicted DNA-binding transcriptional regulator YafY